MVEFIKKQIRKIYENDAEPSNGCVDTCGECVDTCGECVDTCGECVDV